MSSISEKLFGIIDPAEYGITISGASLIDRGESSVYAGYQSRQVKRKVLKVFDVPYISDGLITKDMLCAYQRLTRQVATTLHGETATLHFPDKDIPITWSIVLIEQVGRLKTPLGPASTVSEFAPGERLLDVLEPTNPFGLPRPKPQAIGEQVSSSFRRYPQEARGFLEEINRKLNARLKVACISIEPLNVKIETKKGDICLFRVTDICSEVVMIDPLAAAKRPTMMW